MTQPPKAALLAVALFLLSGPALLFPADEEDALVPDEEEWADVGEGAGITVVGAVETTQRLEVVGKDEIERQNAADLALLLQDALGLGLTRYGGYGSQGGFTLRGFDSERVAVLVDGVPINSPLSGEADLYRVDPGAVERVEVIYGGSDARYNVTGSFGGVINIVTVKRQERGWNFGLSLSNTAVLPGVYRDAAGAERGPAWKDLADTQNLRLSGGLGLETLSLSLSGFVNNAGNHFLYTDDIFNETRRKSASETRDGGAAASLVWKATSLTTLIFTGDLYAAGKNVPASGYAEVSGKERDTASRQSLLLDAPVAFSEALSTEASLTHDWSLLDWTAPEGTSSRHDTHVLSLVNRWGWYPAATLTARAGIDFQLAAVTSSDSGAHTRPTGGVYAGAEWQPHKTLLLTPSLKGVFAPGAAVPLPKLGLLFTPTPALTLKNNYFRAFKLPDFEDLYWPALGGMAGNSALKPEDCWGADLGAVLRLPTPGPLEATLEPTLYAHYTSDSIHWTQGEDALWRPANAAAAAVFGSEARFSLTWRPDSGLLTKAGASLTYQHQESRLLAYGYHWADHKAIPYTSAHSAHLKLDLVWKTGSALLSARWEGPRFADSANLKRLDPYLLVDATVNQETSRTWTLFLSAGNLLNTTYQTLADYPMPGLTLTLGLKARFKPTPTAAAE